MMATVTGGQVRPDTVTATLTRSHWDRWLFGPTTQPRWARPTLLSLLALTFVLYAWNLSVSGFANNYYAAAAQAGTQSWKALLFGSLDSGNAITVDKPPASIWVMGLSGRLFGFGSWSLLMPQAVMGVSSVALLYATVRRWSGPAAGLLAGAVLAATPVAALMFRFDNPDALLVVVLLAAAYCTVRATDTGSTAWIMLAGTAIGFGFLTKLLQAFLVLPGLAAVFAIAAPGSLWRRVLQLGGAAVAVVASAGWYVVLVELWPASSRPYIGGSSSNSLWELAVGYNGLGRIFGQGGSASSGGAGGASHSGGGLPSAPSPFGTPGIGRLFQTPAGTEIAWFLPVAVLGAIALMWISRQSPRTDRLRAATMLWAGWLLVTGLLFSYMSGIFHSYYTVALAPAVAALAGISVTELWRARTQLGARVLLAVMSMASGVTAFVLLGHSPEWLPWLRWTLLVGAMVTSSAILTALQRTPRTSAVVTAAALAVALAGSAIYAADTTTHAHHGGGPTSGPAVGVDLLGPPWMQIASTTPDLDALIVQTDSRWAAASVASFTANSLQLRTGKPVMALGGFGGGDEFPSLELFQRYVSEGSIHYFIPGTGPSGGDQTLATATSAATRIVDWVKAEFSPAMIDGVEVYDLTGPRTVER